MYYILLFFLCFSFTLGLTPLLIKYLKKAQVVDLPGGRHIHKAVIPRMGGLFIYLASSFMLIYFSQDLNSIRLLVLSSLLIFLAGVLDDTLGVSYQIKFIFQLAVAALVTFSLSKQYGELTFLGFVIPEPFDILVLIFFVTAAINSINFLDGLDGLVSKSSVLWFSTIMILSTIYSDQFLTLLSISMVGSILGFLNYNSYPARVFLGDTGSLSIGFYLVISSLIISARISPGKQIDIVFPLILLSIPLGDAFRVILQRLIDKKSPFLPDNTHIHHILLNLFHSQKSAVSILEAFTAFSCIFAIIYATGKHTFALILSVLFIAIIINIKPILKFHMERLHERILWRTISNNLGLIQKLIFGAISVIAILFIVYLFTESRKIDPNISLVLISLGVITFCVTYFSTKKNAHVSELLILLNIVLFFLITNLNKTISAVQSAFSIISYLFSVNDFYILTFLIVIILLSINISISLHFNETWSDTITPLLLAVILVSALFIPDLSNNSFIVLLLGSLTTYMWVRWMVSYYSNILQRLTIFSFGLPFGVLVKLLIS